MTPADREFAIVMLEGRERAKERGKAVVPDEGGVLVLTWHPLARAVTGTDLLATEDEPKE